MNYHLEISAGAENDIKASFLWYEEQQNGLGNKFESIILSTFEFIQKIHLLTKQDMSMFE